MYLKQLISNFQLLKVRVSERKVNIVKRNTVLPERTKIMERLGMYLKAFSLNFLVIRKEIIN